MAQTQTRSRSRAPQNHRQHQHPQQRNRRHGQGGGGGNSGKKALFIILGVVVVAAIVGAVIWFLTRESDFSRKTLDDYVAQQEGRPALNPGGAVYVDFSDGMNNAYTSEETRAALQAVVNALNGSSKQNTFYSVIDGKIEPMADMGVTDIYNKILSPASYTQQQAPIQKTLAQIVSKKQPAVFITDFEEYKGAGIEQGAYAKDEFIQWLAEGFNIYFFKWDFIENGKPKHLFFAVFDDNSEALYNKLYNAIKSVSPNFETFVLPGRGYAYSEFVNYLSECKGGTYHNSKGVDVVSGTIEDCSESAFYKYTKRVADSTGKEAYLPGDIYAGHLAQYYPLTVTWSEIIKTAKAQADPGVPEADRYTHFLSKLYVNFTTQNAYNIRGIEARVFDVEEIVKASQPLTDEQKAEMKKKGENPDTIATPKDKELPDFFTAKVEPVQGTLNEPDLWPKEGWQEILVDFDERFNGTLPGWTTMGNLIRINIVISSVSPVDKSVIDNFFGWAGNASLSESVYNAICSSNVSPVGQILMSYFIKNTTEK